MFTSINRIHRKRIWTALTLKYVSEDTLTQRQHSCITLVVFNITIFPIREKIRKYHKGKLAKHTSQPKKEKNI